MTWLLTIGLANALLATLLAAVAWALGRFLRRPALAHLLWIVVLCKLFTPPLAPIPLDGWPLVGWFGRPSGWLADAADAWSESGAHDLDSAGSNSHGAEAPTASAPLLAAPSSAVAAPPFGAASSAPPSPLAKPATARRPVRVSPGAISAARARRLAAAIWIAGSAVVATGLLRRAWRFRAYLKRAARPEPALQARAGQLARRAGLASAPRVVVVESVVSPMLWGMGRGAQLLFPGPLARRLEPAARDALLLHELAHYARGDGWVRLLELAAQTLYWWHPLVWLARREIEAAEEECCDAWALNQQGGSRRLYAEALLATVDFLYEPPAAPLPPAACGLGEAPLLRRRLTQIMCGDVALKPSRALRAAVLGAAAIVLPLGPTFFGAASDEAAARSMPESLAAPAPPERGPASIAAPAAAGVDANLVEAAPSLVSAFSAPRAPSTHWATAVSPNGKYQLEARTGRKTTLVHVETGWRLDLSSHQLTCASFAPDGRTFASGHDDSLVRIWDSETGGLLASLKGAEAPIASVAFAPDGRRVAAGAVDGGALVWNWADGDEIASLPRQSAPVSCLRWSPRGERIALALGRWSDGDGAALVLWSPGDLRSADVQQEVQPFAEPIGALEWLADGESLLLAAWDGQARIWNVSTASMLDGLRLDKSLVSAAAWSPDCPLAPAEPTAGAVSVRR